MGLTNWSQREGWSTSMNRVEVIKELQSPRGYLTLDLRPVYIAPENKKEALRSLLDHLGFELSAR